MAIVIIIIMNVYNNNKLILILMSILTLIMKWAIRITNFQSMQSHAWNPNSTFMALFL